MQRWNVWVDERLICGHVTRMNSVVVEVE